MADDTEVLVPAEEAPEEPETPETPEEEPEEAPEGEPEGDEPTELTKARKVAEDQRKRAEKAEAELKKLKTKPKTDRTDDQPNTALEQQVAAANERAERAELRSMGITHPDDIKLVRDAAKRLGVDISEAATDEFVANKLERQREVRKTKEATPPPNKRGGGGSQTDIGRLADKVEKGGDLPSDPDLAEKVQKEVARRAQERA